MSNVKIFIAGKSYLPYRPAKDADTYWFLTDEQTTASQSMKWTANFDAAEYTGLIAASAFKAGKLYTYKIGKGHKVKVGDIYCRDNATGQGYIISPADYNALKHPHPIAVVYHVGGNPAFENSSLHHGLAVALKDAAWKVEVIKIFGIDHRPAAVEKYKAEVPLPQNSQTTSWFIPSPRELMYICSSHPTADGRGTNGHTDIRNEVDKTLLLLAGELLRESIEDHWSNDKDWSKLRLNFPTGKTQIFDVGGLNLGVEATVRTCFGF